VQLVAQQAFVAPIRLRRVQCRDSHADNLEKAIVTFKRRCNTCSELTARASVLTGSDDERMRVTSILSSMRRSAEHSKVGNGNHELTAPVTNVGQVVHDFFAQIPREDDHIVWSRFCDVVRTVDR
jgi:hypothetical protein